MADIILDSLVCQINDLDLRLKTIAKIEQCKTFLSDILFFLRGDTTNIPDNEPSNEMVIELYKIYLKSV